jgi:membrane protein
VANKGKARKRKRGAGTPLGEAVGVLVALVALAAGVVRATFATRHHGRRSARPGPPQSPTDHGPHHRQRPQPTGIKARLDTLGRRFRPLGVGLEMNERFGELNGNYLAGAITLQAFLSLFPLLLVTLAVVGFVAAGSHTDVAGSIIGRLGLTGDAAQAVVDGLEAARRSRKGAGVVGFVGLLWSGLALVGALQYAYDQVWQVQARGVKDRALGAAWLLGAAVLFLTSAVVTTVLGFLPGFLWPVGIAVGLATNVALWWWTAKILPNRDVGWRPLLPGAIVGGVGLEVLKLVGRFYVPHAVSSSSQVYGSIGVVFAILAWLFFFGRLVVYSATLNVVLWERARGTETAEIEIPAGLHTKEQMDRTGQAA